MYTPLLSIQEFSFLSPSIRSIFIVSNLHNRTKVLLNDTKFITVIYFYNKSNEHFSRQSQRFLHIFKKLQIFPILVFLRHNFPPSKPKDFSKANKHSKEILKTYTQDRRSFVTTTISLYFP